MDNSSEFRGLRFFPSATEEAWYFLPRRPDVQRGADGRPLLTLVDMGAEAYVLFTATWAAPAGDLQALREEIGRRYPRAGNPVTVGYAPIASARCDALIADGHGTFQAVASSATSGYPPYDAAFNIHLRGDRLEHAKAALHGESGHLAVEYGGQLGLRTGARATLRASAAPLAAWLQAQDARDRASLREALERAIRAGIARVVIEAPDPAAGMLAAELYERVLDRATDLITALPRQPSMGDLQVSAELERDTPQPTSAFADIGALVQAEATATPTGGDDAAD
jgi:hypothetical protein